MPSRDRLTIDPDAAAARVARMTPAQADCIRLAAEHLKTSEIADRLGISDHAVDGRIKAACKALDVTDRAAAARLFRAAEAQKTVYRQSPEAARQSPDLSASTPINDVSFLNTTGRAAPDEVRDGTTVWSHDLPLASVKPPLSPSSPEQRRNDLTMLQRLGVIAAVPIATLLLLSAVGMCLLLLTRLWHALNAG